MLNKAAFIWCTKNSNIVLHFKITFYYNLFKKKKNISCVSKAEFANTVPSVQETFITFENSSVA